MGRFVPRPGHVPRPDEQRIVAQINRLLRGVRSEADWNALTPVHRAAVVALMEQLDTKPRR